MQKLLERERERSLQTEIKKVYEWHRKNFVLKLNQKRLKNYEIQLDLPTLCIWKLFKMNSASFKFIVENAYEKDIFTTGTFENPSTLECGHVVFSLN